MATPTLAQLERDARAAGYRILSTERLRANRWLLVADEGEGHQVAILLQLRSLIGESDVQDLADLVRVRRYHSGMLLVGEAAVSAHAERALLEIGDQRLRICATLPAPTVVSVAKARVFPTLFGLSNRR